MADVSRNNLDGKNIRELDTEEKMQRRILRMFCAYTVFITLLRLAGYGHLAHGLVEAAVYPSLSKGGGILLGGWIFGLLPVAISFYAVKTRLSECSRYAILWFSGLAFFNHVVVLAKILPSIPWVYMLSPGLLFIGSAVIAVLSFFMFVLFRCSIKLGKWRRESGIPQHPPIPVQTAIAICICLAYFVSPKLDVQPKDFMAKLPSLLRGSRDVRVITPDECTLLESIVLATSVSGDGRFIAMGAEDDLTLWDSANRELLLRDTTIAPRSVRFSNSGKYLVAVGKARSQDASCLVFYELDSFTRVSQVVLAPDEDVRKTTLCIDAAFREEETRIACVYYSFWDTMRISWHEKQAMKENGVSFVEAWEPTFCEIDIATGEIVRQKNFLGRTLLEESIESLRFSPDGDALVYVHSFWDEIYRSSCRNFSFLNTTNWEERVIPMNERYSVLVQKWYYTEDPYRRALSSFFPEYNLNCIDEEKIYFIYQPLRFYEVPNGPLHSASRGFVFAELSIFDEKSRDIVCANESGLPRGGMSFMAISPNRRHAAIVMSENKEQNQNFYIIFVDLQVGQRETNIIQKVRFDENNNRFTAAISSIAWLDNEKVVLTTGENLFDSPDRLQEKSRFFYLNMPRDFYN